MIFNDEVPSEVSLYMKEYIQELLKEMNVAGVAKTPALDDLFDEKEDVALSADAANQFYRAVYQLLYLAKRTRPDLLLPVIYLTTRVSKPNREDRRKIWRVLKYLNYTKDVVMNLRALKKDGKYTVHQSIDVSFGKHSDFKSHTGSVMSLGVGAVQTLSSKQKINTKNSTEAKIVGYSDKIGGVWARHLLESVGACMNNVRIEQDNKSALIMMDKGFTGSHKTRHIPVRYFYCYDIKRREHVITVYTPPSIIEANGATKPLQGQEFLQYIAYLMGSDCCKFK